MTDDVAFRHWIVVVGIARGILPKCSQIAWTHLEVKKSVKKHSVENERIMNEHDFGDKEVSL